MSKSKTLNKKGLVFVVSAPSGCGKTTVLKALLKRHARTLKYSVSDTTREPRSGERRGRDYVFITEAQFKVGIQKKRYLEWAEVFGCYYGTPAKRISDITKKGQDVILDVDVVGAKQLMKSLPDAVFIFILPPSKHALQRRLAKRNKNTAADMKKRLAAATREMNVATQYDYIVVNRVVASAVDALESIIKSEKYRTKRNKEVFHAVCST